MNGYLFTAGVTMSQVCPTRGRSGQMVNQLRTWDTCVSAILYGGDPEQAQERFEAWCSRSDEGESPGKTEIKKVVAAEFVDQLFGESGGKPLDWPEISRQVNDALQATPLDDFEQGYWVDINQAVPPGNISFGIESLKRDLPEDIRSGLNWSPDKTFFFLVSVLCPRPTPPEIPADEPESNVPNRDDVSGESEGPGKDTDLDKTIAALPEMRDKEAAALVQARNSVVAAWLWRKFAAGTRFAPNEIHISPCCSFVPVT